MHEILKKLGYTNQNPILIMNAPEEYNHVMDSISAEIHTEVEGSYRFIQIFSKDFEEANEYVNEAIQALMDDGLIWLCYPKGSSKRYKSNINRTKTWELFAPYNYEPVTQVSIDLDWSAMRFRHIDYIKFLKRKTASTEKGKERISEKGK